MRVVTLFLMVIFGLLYLNGCTITEPVKPITQNQPIKLSLQQKLQINATYNGTDIPAIIEFPDSIVCDFDRVISIHRIRAKFYIPDEVILNSKIRELRLPLFWTEKIGLPVDTGTYKLPFDSLYVQAGSWRSNVVKIYIKNLPPYIDSLVSGDTSFHVSYRPNSANDFTYHIRDTVKKSLVFRITAHDLDSPTYSIGWENLGDHSLLIWNPLSNPATAIYKTPQINFVDYITVIVYDTDVSTQVKIKLVKNYYNPYIDSFQIQSTVLKNFTGSSCVYQTVTIDSALVQAFTHSVNIQNGKWYARNGIVIPRLTIDSLGLNAMYVCTLKTKKDTIKVDTLVFMDSLRFVLRGKFGDSVAKSIIIKKKKTMINW